MVKMQNLRSEDGFTYLVLLASVAIIGILTTQVTFSWMKVKRADQEAELLFRGKEIMNGIELYYRSAHAGFSMFPKQLEDLVKPPSRPKGRFVRKLYKDPITNDDWVVITDRTGRVKGVRSKSDLEPQKKGNFPEEFKDFAGATRYSDWRFEYDPSTHRRNPLQPKS